MLFFCETALGFLEVPIGILPVEKAADYNYYQLDSLGIHVKPMILLAVTDWID